MHEATDQWSSCLIPRTQRNRKQNNAFCEIITWTRLHDTRKTRFPEINLSQYRKKQPERHYGCIVIAKVDPKKLSKNHMDSVLEFPATSIKIDSTVIRGREKIAKICKIRGEKLVFSPQILYIILQWNAVK